MIDTELNINQETVKITVDAPDAIKEKLSGEFIREMARQLTREISRAMSIEGLAESNVELKLNFAPETFMEHSSENVTYRRLLITDKACGDKDFWVRWTRNNAAVAYSMTDTPAEGDITFELGEDVSQKVREREYRYLVRTDTDKYHFAMGRKNITEWRELIKRAIKRGDLTKLVSTLETAEPASDVNDALSSLLSSFGVEAPASEPAVSDVAESVEFEDALRRAQEALMNEYSDEDEEKPPFDFTAIEDEPVTLDFSPIEDEEAEDVEETEEVEDVEDVEEEPVEEIEEEAEEEIEEATLEEPQPVVVAEPRVVREIDEERIRAEAEARVRLEYESAARAKAEKQIEAISAELSALKAENERLRGECAMLKIELSDLRAERGALENKKAELEREIEVLKAKLDSAEAERDTEKQRLREEIDARIKAESRERERLEEAAILAVEAQRRAEEARAEEERLAEEAERAAAEEKARAEEKSRIEAERQAEAERIRLEREIARGNLPQEEPEMREEPKAEISPSEYTYTSKSVRLMFKSAIASDTVSKIYEIIKTTVEYYKKEQVSIRIKASVPDETTVILNFVKIPEQESELFVNIIKTLGGSNIGIVKAIVE